MIVRVFLASQWRLAASRKAADLAPPWWPLVAFKAVLLALGLGFLTYYVNIDRGFTYASGGGIPSQPQVFTVTPQSGDNDGGTPVTIVP